MIDKRSCGSALVAAVGLARGKGIEIAADASEVTAAVAAAAETGRAVDCYYEGWKNVQLGSLSCLQARDAQGCSGCFQAPPVLFYRGPRVRFVV